MNRKSLDRRLQELGIYNSYYYKKELKPLAELMEDDEVLNCLFTGVHEANRKLVAVTDRRIIIIFAALAASGSVVSIPRCDVTNFHYENKIFFPKAFISTEKTDYAFTGVQSGQKALFDWAMNRPLPEFKKEESEE